MPGATAHTVKAFDEDLDELRARVAAFGGQAEAGLREAMEALIRRDAAGAEAALCHVEAAKAMSAAVERRAICLIALRAPMADDLREVLSCLKIAALIERIADHAINIARSVVSLEAGRHIPAPVAIGRLARGALEATRSALDGFAAGDDRQSGPLCEAAASAETLYRDLLEDCLGHMRRDPQSVGAVTTLLFVARSLWRVVDLASDVAAAVRFSVTGERAAPLNLAKAS
jgi:phosphate transport system protein